MSVPGTPRLPQLTLLTELVQLPGLPRPPGSSWGVGLEVAVDSTSGLCRGTRRLAQGLRGVCLGSAPPSPEPGLIRLASHWRVPVHLAIPEGVTEAQELSLLPCDLGNPPPSRPQFRDQ